MTRHLAPRLRCALVVLLATVSETLLVGWLGPDLVRGVPGAAAPFESWLVAGCEVATLLVVGWLWVLVLLVAREAGGGRRAPRAGVPGAVRRAVLLACGAGLAGSLVGPATATAPPPSPLDGLPLPDRATSHARPPVPRPAGPSPAGRSVEVVPGDTLWAIAAADLPAGATAAEIDRRWRTLHAANREVIGADPDLILPGQRLRLPGLPSDT